MRNNMIYAHVSTKIDTCARVANQTSLCTNIPFVFSVSHRFLSWSIHLFKGGGSAIVKDIENRTCHYQWQYTVHDHERGSKKTRTVIPSFIVACSEPSSKSISKAISNMNFIFSLDFHPWYDSSHPPADVYDLILISANFRRRNYDRACARECNNCLHYRD